MKPERKKEGRRRRKRGEYKGKEEENGNKREGKERERIIGKGQWKDGGNRGGERAVMLVEEKRIQF